MRTYIARFTKLLNAAENVSVDRAIDAFSDGIRRERYIEDLGRLKPKTITGLMEIANGWADGEDHVRNPRPRSDDDEDDHKHPSSSGHRPDQGSDRCKKRRDHGYNAIEGANMVAAGYNDQRGYGRDDRRDDRRDGKKDDNRANWQQRLPWVPELPPADQVNAPCYLHAYIDPKDNIKKSTHLLRCCRQFIELRQFYEALNPGANVQAYPMLHGTLNIAPQLQQQEQQPHQQNPQLEMQQQHLQI